MKILVTGAGGAAPICVIKSLVKRHEVIATDMDKLAAGLYLAHKGYTVPKSTDPNYLDKIFEIAKQEKVALVIPTVNEEMIFFAKNVKRFSDAGIKVAVSNTESIEISTDKSKLYKFFKNEKYGPKIYTKENAEFPCVVKPRDGRGSRGIHICNSKHELEQALDINTRKNFKDNVIMEYLKGVEYSVYGLSDLNKKPIFAAAVERIETESESKKARITDEGELLETASHIASKIGLIGPWNVQIMKTEKGPKMVEVNPRFAGTTSLVVGAGVDLPELTIKIFNNEVIDEKELKFKTNLHMTRYNEEIFIEPNELIEKR